MRQTRKLGFTETYAKFCHDHANGSTILVGMIQVTGPVTAEIIRQGLALLRRRHALLRAHIVESRKEEDFFRIDDGPRPFLFVSYREQTPINGFRLLNKIPVSFFLQINSIFGEPRYYLGIKALPQSMN